VISELSIIIMSIPHFRLLSRVILPLYSWLRNRCVVTAKQLLPRPVENCASTSPTFGVPEVAKIGLDFRFSAVVRSILAAGP
jgi:hypothetical protein